MPPAISSLNITSEPGTGNFYAIGEDITFTATFDEAVTVTGRPKLAFSLNDAPKSAYAQAASSSTTVAFTYTVAQNDQGDTIIVSGDSITLNEGSIDSSSGDVAANLNHHGLAVANLHRVDGVSPSLSTAAVDGSTLTLTYGEALDGNSVPPATAFSTTIAGAARAVSGVSMSGNTVTLTLGSAVTADDPVPVGYTQPAGDSATPLQDLAGNAAPSFSGQAATNNTEAASDTPTDPEPEETDAVEPQDPLTASTHGVPGSHDGENVFTFELCFSEALKSGFKFRTLRDHALTATGGQIVKAQRLDNSGNLRWTIHVQPDGDGSATVCCPSPLTATPSTPSAPRTAGRCPTGWS